MSRDTLSRQVAELLPDRVATFLRAVGTCLPIRQLLAKSGYTKAEHVEGWRLLLEASGAWVDFVAPNDIPATRAIAELDALDAPLFRRVRAALERYHPEQASYVFEGLSPGRSVEAVVSVATFLTRLDALESNPLREATRRADRAALEILAARGITKTERQRLRGLVQQAQELAPAEPVATDDGILERRAALVALHRWYREWSETARAVIPRGDHLVRLGLTKRKKSERNAAKQAA